MNTLDGKGCTKDENHSTESALLDSDSHFPDGGLTAWLTAFGAFLVQFGGFGFVNAFGVFQGIFLILLTPHVTHSYVEFYSQHYLTNVSSSTVSWIGSTNSFLILSGGLFFGRLYDRGHFHWLVIGGCSLQTICLFLLSLTQRNQFYQIFLCHGLGFGLATSMSYVPSLAVLSHHFKKRLAIAMSIVAGGAPLGAAVYTILLNNLLNGGLGFANSICITAAANSVILLTGCALMRTRSLYPKTQLHYSQLLRTSSTDYPYMFASIGLFFFGAGSFFPVFYIQLDSTLHGLGKEFSFYTIVILNGGHFIGRATAGFIAACCGIPYAVIGATLGSGIVTFAMMTLSTRAGAASIGIFFGYFSGVCQ
ncbi:major facilitator superfamily domain-containing protein [Lanmaoa asiatica]|nr:major facilitator superfamily domain-containing protein [Lanmaoa asiatica]